MPNRSARESHGKALDLAWQALEERGAGELARLSGSRLSAGRILLPFFERKIDLDMARKEVTLGEREAEPSSSVLALHYLAACDEGLPTGRLVPFNQAEGGYVYHQAFKARSIDRLAAEFGRTPSRLALAAARIGGRGVALGSCATEVPVFPKLLVTAIVWGGDEEVPASANLLFDGYALGRMPTEDLAVAGSLVVSRLVKANALIS